MNVKKVVLLVVGIGILYVIYRNFDQLFKLPNQSGSGYIFNNTRNKYNAGLTIIDDNNPVIDPMNNPTHTDDVIKYFGVQQRIYQDSEGNITEVTHPSLTFAGRELFPLP